MLSVLHRAATMSAHGEAEGNSNASRSTPQVRQGKAGQGKQVRPTLAPARA